MRWLADECVHATVVAELRRAGHEVLYASEEAQRTNDETLAEMAARENRILLTEDKDFGDIVFLHGGPMIAVVLLRIDPKRRNLKWLRLARVLKNSGRSSTTIMLSSMNPEFVFVRCANCRIRSRGGRVLWR